MRNEEKTEKYIGMLNPMRNKKEGKYRGGEGKTFVTTSCPEDRSEGKTSLG